MCTVTWLDDPCGGYAVWFNRDERRDRPPGLAPARADAGGLPYLAPVDAEAGGTWLAVNAAGVTVGLLNHYAADAARAAARASTPAHATPPAAPRSRGLLVRDLMACRSVAAVVAALDGGRAAAYRPFEIVALDPSGDRARLTWDGRVLARARGDAVRPPVSSSGHNTAAVLASRAAAYEALVGPGVAGPATAPGGREAALARLEAYQRSHHPARGAFSVCMHRPDARTVSLTLVTVAPAAVAMRYGDGPACTAVLGPAIVLARGAAAADGGALRR